MVNGTGSILSPESHYSSVFAIDVMSDAELIRIVEKLRTQVRILRLENEVLEASIIRLQPSLMTGLYSSVEFAKKLSQSSLSVDGPSRSKATMTDYGQSLTTIKSTTRIFNRKLEPSIRTSSVKMSRSFLGSTGPKINVEEKLELVHAVMENLGNDLIKFKSTVTKQNAFLKAQLEEIALRSIDIDNWTLDFENEVVIEGVEMLTKRIPAETWIRFMTEQDKKVDKQIGKLRLRLSTANTQHRKLREDIKRKKELKSRLQPVDVEIKTIEITNAFSVIEQINKNINGQKARTAKASKNLIMHKNALMNTTNHLKQVQNLSLLRKNQTVKLDAETALLDGQAKFYEKNLNWYQELRRSYIAPDVMDYVRIKLEMSELNNSIKRLETSLSIKQCAISNIKGRSIKLKRMKSTNAVCEIPLKVTESQIPKKTCSPCGLMPRD